MKECDHQWTDNGTLQSGNNPRIEIEACVRCGVQRKKVSEQPQESAIPGWNVDGTKRPTKDIKYVVMVVERWDNLLACTPVQMPIQPLGRSVGFLLVYETLEALRADYPDRPYVTEEPEQPCTCDHSASDVITDSHCPQHGQHR
jgi:hypothetical protein